MRYISLFAGIGGFELAISRVFPEAQCIGYCEIDRKCRLIYQKHFPHHPLISSDIATIDFSKFAEAKGELVVAGFPCQDLSRINRKGKGLQGPKSSLFHHVRRCLKETQSKYFLIENVASMKKTDRKQISDGLGVQPIELDASCFTAQRRKRLFWTNLPLSAKDCFGHPFEENLCLLRKTIR